MAALKRSLAALALCWAAPATAGTLERWAGYIEEAAARFQIPSAWIRRVMAAESGGRTRLNGRSIESSAGALGLMQLMPGTWREMRAVHGLGPDPHNPRDNIMAGTAYLRLMYDRFGYPGLFAAYNAGPARFAGYLATGRRLPAETVAYVARVAGSRLDPKARMPAPPTLEPGRGASLFAIAGAVEPMGVARDEPVRASASASLFVRLSGASAQRD